MTETKVYLLVLMIDDEIAQMHSKVFTSFDFAKTLRDDMNKAFRDTDRDGLWCINEFELDTFQTIKDLKED